MNGSVVKRNVGSCVRLAIMAAAVWTACSAAGAAPAPNSWILSAEAWAVPRQAETILAMPPMAAAVRALLATSQGRLVITYPATEEGGLWGSELRDWLVSLGIDSDRIQLQAASSSAKQINLSVLAAPTGRNTP